MSLSNLRNELLEIQLSFLWECWSSVGVSGYQGNDCAAIIDPEALLLYTLNIGRYDNRLYDEVIDWCRVNGQFFSIPRLKRLLKSSDELIIKQVGMLAEILSKQTTHKKWNTLQKLGKNSTVTENLFYLKSGEKLPIIGNNDELFLEYGLKRNELKLRGYSQRFDPLKPSSLLLKLRSLMGGTARCEIIVALLNGAEKHPSLLARETGYYQKTIQDTIVEMTWSGVVSSRQKGREKLYRLTSEFISSLRMADNQSFPQWIDKLPLCGKIWKIVEQVYSKNLPFSTLEILLNKELSKNSITASVNNESLVIDLVTKLLLD